MSKQDPRDAFEKGRSGFVKEYTGPARDIVRDGGFKKLDKNAKEQLRESAQTMTGARSSAQITVFRSKDGKRRIVVRGNK